MILKINDLILLTGAGFTKNFGGFLGEEMWAKIFNAGYDKQQTSDEHKKIRLLLLKEFNYEEIYSKVIENKKREYSQDQTLYMQQCIFRAYELLDKAIKTGEARNLLRTFYKRFLLYEIYERDKKSVLWFTLNQDLLVERMMQEDDYNTVGMRSFKIGADDEFRGSNSIHLPELTSIEKLNNEIDKSKPKLTQYIKLHGSYGWKHSSHIGGQDAMVLGINKEDILTKEPLLKGYFNLFKNTINQKYKRLLIIGYGFNDPHINRIISQAVKNKNKLKLHIITPTNIKKFLNSLDNKYQNSFKHSIEGYYPYYLKDILGNPSLLEEIVVNISNQIYYEKDINNKQIK